MERCWRGQFHIGLTQTLFTICVYKQKGRRPSWPELSATAIHLPLLKVGEPADSFTLRFFQDNWRPPAANPLVAHLWILTQSLWIDCWKKQFAMKKSFQFGPLERSFAFFRTWGFFFAEVRQLCFDSHICSWCDLTDRLTRAHARTLECILEDNLFPAQPFGGRRSTTKEVQLTVGQQSASRLWRITLSRSSRRFCMTEFYLGCRNKNPQHAWRDGKDASLALKDTLWMVVCVCLMNMVNNCRSAACRMWLKIGSVTSDFLSAVGGFLLFIYKLQFQGSSMKSFFFSPTGFKLELIHYVYFIVLRIIIK